MQIVPWRAGSALVLLGAFALVLGTGSGVRGRVSAQQVATPPGPVTPSPGAPPPSTLPAVPTAAPTPTPSPTGGRRHGRPAASATTEPEATATPTSPAFSTLDGNWDVQVQRIDTTFYSRFTVKQDGSTITGTWFVNGKQVPLEGTYDGRLFHFVAKDPSGSSDLSGYVENATDMVGIVDNGKGNVPNANPLAFTAEHHGAKPTYPPKVKKKG